MQWHHVHEFKDAQASRLPDEARHGLLRPCLLTLKLLLECVGAAREREHPVSKSCSAGRSQLCWESKQQCWCSFGFVLVLGIVLVGAGITYLESEAKFRRREHADPLNVNQLHALDEQQLRLVFFFRRLQQLESGAVPRESKHHSLRRFISC